MPRLKVCVITGTRAEYGLFLPILKRIRDSELLTLQLVTTTMHHSQEFGLTYLEIEKDGFTIDEKVENLLASDSNTAMAKSTGLAIILIAGALDRLSPNVVLLLGDRFETHAAATTAMLMNIPIAHIHGGELTEGAIDEKTRHSITKMAHLHFTSTQESMNRVIQMGENPDRVWCTGAPGLDNIAELNFVEKKQLENELQWEISKGTALFTYHPETLSEFDVAKHFSKILQSIKESRIRVLFTYSNADPGGQLINQAIEAFVAMDKNRYCAVKSLGQLRYLSAMRYTDLLIGNTSSGIIEAASFHKPVVNIGIRQKGRLKSGNVIDCDVNNLGESIVEALKPSFIKQCKGIANIYGDGSASKRIVHRLESQSLVNYKRFYDL